jgi:hypothetical protein
MFYRLPAQTYGYFATPQWYPGPTTTIRFDNGTEQTYDNRAVLQEERSWSVISDGDSFYSTFVEADIERRGRRETTIKTTPHVPKRLQHVRQVFPYGNAEIMPGYPEPYVTGSRDMYLNGYFVGHPSINNLAALSIQTFDTQTDADNRRFQSLIEGFLAEAKIRGSEKVIIDVSSNPGGSVVVGYDAFLQAGHFFPS